MARQIAAELATMGFVIVSGLALGIDTYAHQACLDAGGRTVAVLGSGIDRVYPASNRGLAKRMVHHEGTVISEFPPGTEVKPYHFPHRNRIISGLTHACVLVEASEKSGTLITARHCLDQGRDLFAVPGLIHQASARGTNKLIHDGEAELLLDVPTLLQRLQPLLGLAAAQALQSTSNTPI